MLDPAKAERTRREALDEAGSARYVARRLGECAPLPRAPEGGVDDHGAAPRQLGGSEAPELGVGPQVELVRVVLGLDPLKGLPRGEPFSNGIGAEHPEPGRRRQVVRELGLAAARETADDQHQWLPRLPGEPPSEREQFSGGVARGLRVDTRGVELPCAQQLYL